MKPWYISKLVWLGVVQFLLGSLGVAYEFLQNADYSPASITVLLSGILTVVLRVWFTEAKLY